MKRKPDIVVISDVHLGTYGAHARELLNYLKSIQPDTLIINGDFIDIRQFRTRYLPPEHLQVIERVLRMASKGTKVYYITGNLDDFLRRYTDFSSGNIHLRDKLVLRLNGFAYWVFHGDIFDTVVRYAPSSRKVFVKSYNRLLRANRLINSFRRMMGKSPMSYSRGNAYQLEKTQQFIRGFEETAMKICAEQEYDYVICGHVHKPCIRTEQIGDRQITYLNPGDWVEHKTALEYQGGRWNLYEYDETEYNFVNPRLHVPDRKRGREQRDESIVPDAAELFAQIVGRQPDEPTDEKEESGLM